MRLLVLGGSWFLGAQIVTDALRAGWEVTTFRRGRTGSDVAGASTVRGDRSSVDDLAGLRDASPWDAVVDTSGYVPGLSGRGAPVLRVWRSLRSP
jgi:2'-hydroxyisoflavone reductase